MIEHHLYTKKRMYVDKVGYDYWLVSDVMPGRLDGINVLNSVRHSIKPAKKLISKVNEDELWAAIRSNDALAAYDMFYAAMGLD